MRTGQTITTNQICGFSKHRVLVLLGFLCGSNAFVTKMSKMLLRKLSDPKSELTHAGASPVASGLSWGWIQDMAAAGAWRRSHNSRAAGPSPSHALRQLLVNTLCPLPRHIPLLRGRSVSHCPARSRRQGCDTTTRAQSPLSHAQFPLAWAGWI